MVVAAPYAEATITCGQVATSLGPCLGYLRGGAGPSPPAGCCNGVRSLNSKARTTPDRQAGCNCLKSLARTSGINANYASGLPGKCGVSIGYPISLSVDCSKVR
ncbi:non-specific lipid-transfer protein [Ralstonia pseudosolanacearum]|uniref:non-specific lipid-transfer protein n=1 Tax=Ralstonia pseudosolanacearum TaxID=1310165 RepID=UPI003CE905F7